MGWADNEVERVMEKKEAIRNPVNTRYDLLDVDFLDLLAKIAHYGAETYGEGNWMISRLTKDKGPINHIYKHLRAFKKQTPYDHKELGGGVEIHLAAIAFNAMMEFYHVMKEKEK